MLLLLACGCGSDSNRQGLRGTVTFDDQPVQNGVIRFIPASGTGGPSAGGEIDNGEFAIEPAKGVLCGSFRVEITASRKTGRKVRDRISGQTTEVFAQFLPPQYNVNSYLTRRSQERRTEPFRIPPCGQDSHPRTVKTSAYSPCPVHFINMRVPKCLPEQYPAVCVPSFSVHLFFFPWSPANADLLASSRLLKLAEEWTFIGNWSLEDSLLSQTDAGGQAYAFYRGASFADVTMEVSFRVKEEGDGVRAAGMILHSSDSESAIFVHFDTKHDQIILFRRNMWLPDSEIARKTNVPMESGKWIDARVDVIGDTINVSLDGTSVSYREGRDQQSRAVRPLYEPGGGRIQEYEDCRHTAETRQALGGSEDGVPFLRRPARSGGCRNPRRSRAGEGPLRRLARASLAARTAN